MTPAEAVEAIHAGAFLRTRRPEHESSIVHSWRRDIGPRLGALEVTRLPRLAEAEPVGAVVGKALSRSFGIAVDSIQAVERVQELEARVRRLERDVSELKRPSVTVMIASLAPEPYELTRPIPVLLSPEPGGFVGSFLDANVNASGKTEHEALTLLKAMMVDDFEVLSSFGPEELGPGQARDLAALREFLRPIERP
jgi:hypothetical protein